MIRSTRSLLLAAALTFSLTACLAPPARSQQGPQLTIDQSWRTFSAAVEFSPATTANADFFTITGPSALQSMVRVSRIECQGTSTAADLTKISVIKRSAIPTVAGTSTSPTAVLSDAADATAATGVVRAYTVAPTPGAAVGTIRIGKLLTSVTGTPTATPSVVWDFTTRAGERTGVILRSAAAASTQVLALNGTMPAGIVVNCNVTWMEQP